MRDFILPIPSNLDFNEIISNNELELDIDYLNYTLNYILNGLAYYIENYNPDKGYLDKIQDIYVPIHSKKDVLVRHNKHKKHIEFLISDCVEHTRKVSRTKFVTEYISVLYGKRYTKGKASYSYRMNPAFMIKELNFKKIDDVKFINKILKYRSVTPPILKSGKYRFLFKYFEKQNLKINFDEAVKLCNLRWKGHNDYGKYLNEIFKIVDLNNHIYKLYYTEETDSRIHSNITMLPKVYREFISYNNKSLVEVDLSNSIFYFLSMLVSDNVSNYLINNNLLVHMFYKTLESLSIIEIELVRELTISGQFYDSFIDDIRKEFDVDSLSVMYRNEVNKDDDFVDDYGQIREIAKKYIIAMINAESNSEKYLGFRNIFKNKFPSLLNIINNFKDTHGNKKLSHMLLQIESHYVLDVVAREFNKKYYSQAPIFTLHDCLITTEDFGDELENLVIDTLKDRLSIAPMVKKVAWL
ncbi:hypothetical protein [Bizionia psychrotolerans]|uniref:hypothetical protein n=1 Tax=Bizionia psychrotolerans TaxID=1492901 RepID=UPI0006521290|nr:hypothetical protein [Bizionia psychrotolerans]